MAEPAFFELRAGGRADGDAEVTLTRSSISVRFTPTRELVVPKAAYGEDDGAIAACDGVWSAPGASLVRGRAGDGLLFSAMTLRLPAVPGGEPAVSTRLVIAGDAWRGSGKVGGRAVTIAPLSVDPPTHHERSLEIVVAGTLDENEIEAMRRACSFVGGIDVELLQVEQLRADGTVRVVEHRRGYRRVGRGPHSPFVGVDEVHRMRAWSALVEAFPRLLAEGVPLDMIVDQIAAHNQVAQIHVSAPLLLMSIFTAAHERLHGGEVGPAAASRRPELERLDADLGLGLGAADVERLERLRVELLDGGFFHAPGYETGRPQTDIKFIRDVAHVVVLRLCGYSGPFYGAERFAVRELAGSP
jgi:hypothetical protein